MTPKEILIAARAKIADPKHWTKGHFAINAAGIDTKPEATDAVCWCSIGAIEAVEDWRRNGSAQAKDLLTHSMGGGIAEFNDTHTHAEVLAKFDEAINAA